MTLRCCWHVCLLWREVILFPIVCSLWAMHSWNNAQLNQQENCKWTAALQLAYQNVNDPELMKAAGKSKSKRSLHMSEKITNRPVMLHFPHRCNAALILEWCRLKRGQSKPWLKVSGPPGETIPYKKKQSADSVSFCRGIGQATFQVGILLQNIFILLGAAQWNSW